MPGDNCSVFGCGQCRRQHGVGIFRVPGQPTQKELSWVERKNLHLSPKILPKRQNGGRNFSAPYWKHGYTTTIFGHRSQKTEFLLGRDNFCPPKWKFTRVKKWANISWCQVLSPDTICVVRTSMKELLSRPHPDLRDRLWLSTNNHPTHHHTYSIKALMIFRKEWITWSHWKIGLLEKWTKVSFSHFHQTN